MNEILQGDCLDLMGKLPSESIDFVFCDYPFNCQDGRKEYVPFVEATAREFKRLLKTNCVLLVVNNPANIVKTLHAFKEFHHRDTIILTRKGSIRPAYRFGFQHNQLLTFVNGEDIKYKWNGTKVNHDKTFLTDVIPYQNGYRGKGKDWHPQAMPYELVARFVEIFSDENDVVLDPFMGSDTTALACVELGRRFIGMEYNQKYVDMANKRIGLFSC